MDDQRAEHLSRKLGESIRKVRISRKLSMEMMAKEIGISKLTLLKIEKGEGNPTLAVVWKIANALQLPIASLLQEQEEGEVVKRGGSFTLSSVHEDFTAELLFQTKNTEVYQGYIKANSVYQSEPHREGVVECVTVLAGRITIQVEDRTYQLETYDSIRFDGDRSHSYCNEEIEGAKLHFVITHS
ncbi:helix-turn-helix domain-containing protein [Geomicrobium sp. JCM 19055]|uniref:helix-turn-helix domain-containing protein n=1 Tax=Geomicrobium sp. JCM 19055 TaxID=1460649 RepID=UPI00045ED300|nr:helix-turn-helix domain-containing protein [Geomicrobium sp. JCM 19055]GAJ99296.1 DNA-binding protein [Geomicrobium sp. JCM 19055]